MTMGQADSYIKKYVNNEIIVKRFKSYLEEQPDGCIVWTGAKSDKGYGVFNIYFKANTRTYTVRAHRFSYALANGFNNLPLGTDTTQNRKVLHHKCENKACVNPSHLEVVTDRFNLGRVNDKNMF
jgi:hypothetical protein